MMMMVHCCSVVMCSRFSAKKKNTLSVKLHPGKEVWQRKWCIARNSISLSAREESVECDVYSEAV